MKKGTLAAFLAVCVAFGGEFEVLGLSPKKCFESTAQKGFGREFHPRFVGVFTKSYERLEFAETGLIEPLARVKIHAIKLKKIALAKKKARVKKAQDALFAALKKHAQKDSETAENSREKGDKIALNLGENSAEAVE